MKILTFIFLPDNSNKNIRSLEAGGMALKGLEVDWGKGTGRELVKVNVESRTK